MDGSKASSQIGHNSFKSMKKKTQTYRQSALVFHKAQFRTHSSEEEGGSLKNFKKRVEVWYKGRSS